MPHSLIIIAWIIGCLAASVLVMAALTISSRISDREGVEQPLDTADTEQSQRFPRCR